MLLIQNLNLELNGKKILNNVNLELKPREIHAILGLNGSGKSTLAYAIMGSEGYKPTSGKIFLNKRNITNLSITKRAKLGITLAWQEPARFEGLSIKDYLSINLKGNKKEAELALQMVNLDPKEYLHRELGTSLSGGERKRIELASILTIKPRLAILDEPDSGIDFLSLNEIMNVIKTLKEKYNGIVLLITHREKFAEMADRASLMCNKTILRTGAPKEIGRFFREKCSFCKHKRRNYEKFVKGL